VDRLFDGKAVYVPKPQETCAYTTNFATQADFINDPVQFDIELADFFKKWEEGFFASDENCKDAMDNIFCEPAFFELAVPMVWAHRVYKQDGIRAAMGVVADKMDIVPEEGIGSDWALACYQWLERRQAAKLKKEQDEKDAKAHEVGLTEVA
jgi:hypothetical protein